jgi:gas vesicle protein
MAIELSRPVDKKLRAGVAGLEMEISDSVMQELLAALAERLQDDSDDSAASLLLMAMDSVARHVDALRVRSDLRAFTLIEELWKAYEDILTSDKDEKDRLSIAASEMKKVLDWQQQCYLDVVNRLSLKKAADADRSSSLLKLVQEQIGETGTLVEQEVAALKELAGTVSLTASTETQDFDQRISTAIAEQVDSLQELMNQELSKLRQELQPASGRD